MHHFSTDPIFLSHRCHQLKRAGFIGAASAWFLANLGGGDLPAVWQTLAARSLRRTGLMLQRRSGLPPEEAACLTRFHFRYERSLLDSVERFLPVPAELRSQASGFFQGLERTAGGIPPARTAAGPGQVVYARNQSIRGPMSAFGYDYFEDHYGAERSRSIRLLRYRGLCGSGGDYAYEALNLVDGRRTAQGIRDDLSAIYGPVPLELVLEYLQALQSIGVLQAP